MATFIDDKAAEWNVHEQKLNEEICDLKKQVEQAKKLAAHISEQQQYELDTKLGNKERELAKAKEECQHLAALLQRHDAGLNEIRKENKGLKAELDRMKKENQDLKTEKENLDIQLSLENVAKMSAVEQVAKLDDDIKKKEKLHEITASEKRDTEERLQKITHEFKQERDKLLRQVHKVDVQRQRNHYELEVAIADTARLSDEVLSKTQQVNQYKKQAETSKVQLQEERMKVQYLQETLHNLNEEHKEEVLISFLPLY